MDTLHQGTSATEGGALDTPALIRTLLEAALNEVMDEQADMACEGGAKSRNGYRERGLITPAGKITLRIPKLRCGTCFPEGMLERYSRVDKAVAAAVAEMYANGVSTRKVERIAQKMGIDGLSPSQVSRICERLDAEVAALRAREFDMDMPYLFLDATYVKCRREGRVASTAVVTAIAECFPGAAWQRCVVHLERNVCSMLPSKRQRRAAGKVMQAVFAQEDLAMVRAAYHAAIDTIASFSRAAAELLEDAECDALAYLAFPAEHRRRIRTNNVQERANREIKRRTRAVQVFPSVESMIRLVEAVMAELDEDWSCRCAIASMDLLERPAAPEPAIDEETAARAERLVLVAMESAGAAGKAS